ncbi:uncharacterized protein LOC100864998 [Apis florea]|uniref:uncharacterized protein LOC100864998 n=1 Tax=Apis florea TaxID=7463 RepID=UPI0012FEAC0D|nr:uncharacterized protein LOC100864998 [Apis florea]
MATRKSMSKRLIDSTIHSSPASSSPLRRKSILPQKLNNFALSENDDEAERLARRREITDTSTTTISTNSSDKRRSLGLSFLVNMPPSQMAERISQCIKLGTENKINPKNAFSLEMIDFMTYMIKKKDANMSNLQVATTSLDVSTKIYGFRVDGVHMDILKMIAGTKTKSMSKRLIDSTIHSSPASSSPLRRKSILPQKLNNFALSENDDEAERLARRREITDTSTTTISTNSSDKRRSLGLSFLVNMPPSQMAERISQCIKLGTENKINPKNAFSLEMIDFMTYMIKKKDANMSNLQVATTSLDVSTKIYGFRVDDTLKMNVETEKPSLITIEADLQTTDMLYQVMLPNHANSKFYPHSYNDILIDTVNNKDIQDKNTVYDIPKIANFSHMEICPPLFYFDFHNECISTGMNYFDIEVTEEEHIDRCVMISNQVENIVDFREVLTKTISLKDSEYSFIQTNLNIHWAELCYDDETIERVCVKFLPSQSIKLHARTAKIEWNEEILTLPPDKHYNIKQEYQENKNNTINNDMQCQDECISETQMPFTGNNLVAAPKLTNKVSIAYYKNIKETITKKAMQQDNNNKMNDSKFFSEIYKRLPNILTKTNIDALSFPISFVSLLHLANEKTLKINSSSDMSDLIIEQD